MELFERVLRTAKIQEAANFGVKSEVVLVLYESAHAIKQLTEQWDCRTCYWFEYKQCGRVDGICKNGSLHIATLPVHLISDAAKKEMKNHDQV